MAECKMTNNRPTVDSAYHGLREFSPTKVAHVAEGEKQAFGELQLSPGNKESRDEGALFGTSDDGSTGCMVSNNRDDGGIKESPRFAT